MADEAQKQVETQATEQTKPEIQTETIDYKKLYEETTQSVEKLKLDLAGTDRARAKALKEKEDLLKVTETAQQTADREAKERQDQILKERQENEEALKLQISEITALKIEKEAYKLNVDPEKIKLLGFTTVEQVKTYADEMALMRKAIEAETTERLNKEISSVKLDNYNINTKTETLSPLEKKIINAR